MADIKAFLHVIEYNFFSDTLNREFWAFLKSIFSLFENVCQKAIDFERMNFVVFVMIAWLAIIYNAFWDATPNYAITWMYRKQDLTEIAKEKKENLERKGLLSMKGAFLNKE